MNINEHINIKAILTLFIFIYPVYFGSIPAKIKPNEIIENLQNFINTYPQEKVYVHTDKPLYGLGDDLWYKVYLVNVRDHLPITPSALVYLELLNPKDSIVATRHVKIEENWDHGDIKINKDWPKGKYTLRGYTSYMCNYNHEFIFHKEIYIGDPFNINPDSEETALIPNLQFFPEGGQMVDGIKSVIAFKATDRQGSEVNLEGEIYNDKGVIITPFKTYTPGFGLFNLLPEDGRQYTAHILWEGREYEFKLPEAEKEGYVMNVMSRNKEFILINLFSSKKKNLKGGYIIAHMRGQPLAIIEDINGREASFKIAKEGIEEGLIHLTFFNEDGDPMCERLVFNQKQNSNINVALSSNYAYYRKRQNAEIEIKMNESNGRGVSGHYSCSITDSYLVESSSSALNIYNYLMLISDLKEKVNNPGFYLDKKNPKQEFFLDLLLMTHGWRRFKWENIIDKKEPELNFPPQSGFDFKGTVSKKGKPISRDLTVSFLSEEFNIIQISSNNKGEYQIEDIAIRDTTDIIFQAQNEKQEKENDIEIVIESSHQYEINYHFPKMNDLPAKDKLEKYLLSSLENQRIDSFYQVDFSIDLEEITVRSQRATIDKKLKKERSIPYGEVDNRLLLDSLKFIQPYYTVFDIVRATVPGVEVVGTPGVNQEFRIRGSNSIVLSTTATVLINGAPASTGAVNALRATDIEFVDVLKGLSKTAVYGGAGSNGVIAIYTRLGKSSNRQRKKIEGLFNTSHPGYYKAREFYSPDYTESSPLHQRPDYRTTLLWEPSIKIDSTGTAIIKFYTADRNTTYKVDIQGITDNGQVVAETFTFDVKSDE